MMTKKRPDPRLAELTRVMVQIMDLSGLSRREIARRLGGDYGVRRILDHNPELRVRQLLSFADAVEMKPTEILLLALGDDGKPSPMALRIHQWLHDLSGLAERLQFAVAPPAGTGLGTEPAAAAPPAAAAGPVPAGAAGKAARAADRRHGGAPKRGRPKRPAGRKKS